jgi:hypothetical protein
MNLSEPAFSPSPVMGEDMETCGCAASHSWWG